MSMNFIEKIKKLDIIGNVFPAYGNRAASKMIMEKINDIFNKDPNNINLKDLHCASDLSKVPLNIVEKTYHEALERKKTIEDKAKINIFGVTIFISLITALSTSIVNLYSRLANNVVKYVFFIIGISAILYMLFGGLLALEVLMNKNTIYIINEDEQIVKKNIRKKIYAKLIDLNGYYNIIRNNYINSSYQCIRNALYILLVIFIINLLPFLNNDTNNQQEELEKMNKQITELKLEMRYVKEELENKNKNIEKIQNSINNLQEENKVLIKKVKDNEKENK